VKGYDPGGTNWRLGKGKPPLDPQSDLYTAYRGLWERWAVENPALIEELRKQVTQHGHLLSDRFATTPISQARALSDLLNLGYGA
jgi:hypothetical protein